MLIFETGPSKQTALEYVATDGYKEEPNFQRWLQSFADRMREEGKEVKVWE